MQTGFTARGRLELVETGGVLAIQLRDIAPEGDLDPESLSRVDLAGLPARYFARAGDVLFRPRGERNTATALDVRFTEPALALLPLVVLRPKPNAVTPDYLAWAINQPAAQRHFAATARGTNLRMVPRPSLDALELDIPDIETQRGVIAVDALAKRERDLTLLAADKRKQLTGLILAQRVKRGRSRARTERTAK